MPSPLHIPPQQQMTGPVGVRGPPDRQLETAGRTPEPSSPQLLRAAERGPLDRQGTVALASRPHDWGHRETSLGASLGSKSDP